MSPAVISITIVAYFIILFTISYIAGRKADNEGFFVGNRKSAWYIVTFAMIGSTISGVTFVSVPGMIQTSSVSYLQMVLRFIVGQIIIAFVLVPLFYRMNLVSIYEYLENRFGCSSYKTGAWFNGYQISYELLITNALFTFLGLCLLIKRQDKETSHTTHTTKQEIK